MRNGGVHDSARDEAWQDLTLPVADVMRLAWRLLLGTAVAAFVPFVLLWGLPSLPDLHEVPRWLGEAFVAAVLFVLVYLASAVVHEGLHAFAMVAFAGVPVRAVRFGLRLSEGVAYVHAARPMTVRAYRVVLVLPGLVQGYAGTNPFSGSDQMIGEDGYCHAGQVSLAVAYMRGDMPPPSLT